METVTTNPIILWVADRFYLVFLGFIILNVLQRKHGKRSGRKRVATLYLAIATFLLMAAAQMVISYGLGEWVFVLSVAVVLYGMYHFRSRTFPFRLRSPVDGRRYSWEEILFMDDPEGIQKPVDTPPDKSPQDDD